MRVLRQLAFGRLIGALARWRGAAVELSHAARDAAATADARARAALNTMRFATRTTRTRLGIAWRAWAHGALAERFSCDLSATAAVP